MSQVFAFCRQSGGEVQIQSTEGEGTRVAMLLPVAQPATGLAEADSGNAAALTAAPGTAPNILVVEAAERLLAATAAPVGEPRPRTDPSRHPPPPPAPVQPAHVLPPIPLPPPSPPPTR